MSGPSGEIATLDQLIYRMERGLTPTQISRDQVEMLNQHYGNDWFDRLGYDEDYYERSIYDPKHKRSVHISRLDKLLENLREGLLPEELTKDEVQLIKEHYGEKWFATLGLAEPSHRKPLHDAGGKPLPPLNTDFVRWKTCHPQPNYHSWAEVTRYYRPDGK